MAVWLGWHFLREDGTTGYGNRKPVPGKLMHCRGELVLCENGLHASRRAIDALYYAPGPIVQRVELIGVRIDDTDKSCARTRRCLWIADAERTLHEFAVWCAERALQAERKAGREPDARSWEALAVKRRWLDGQATDKQLHAARAAVWEARAAVWEAQAADLAADWAAAREAAWQAAWQAAWEAAWDAAREAAWVASREAAGEAAGDAARYAAWDAAREAQNAELERRLMALAPAGYKGAE